MYLCVFGTEGRGRGGEEDATENRQRVNSMRAYLGRH